ncbi:MAG TPA: Ig-like domain-containing protein, partial [Acidimicrobiia bacterium]|nr:Ig-like domain-containing protein [Acidimicrobiia bacterium]
MTPGTGPFFGGTTVTITGTGFDTTPGNTTFALGTNPDTASANVFANVTCSSSTTCTATTPFGPTGPGSGTLDVLATVNGVTSPANAPSDSFAYGSTIATGSKNVAYVTDFGTGLNDTSGPGSGSGIFANAIGNTSWGGTAPGTGTTGTFAGVKFTDVTVGTIDASPTTAFNGFDTVVLYQVCDIGSHAGTITAINSFLTAGGKVIIYDADRCFGSNTPDYSSFLFPFSSSNPGPQGASGSFTVVDPSSLTAGLSVGPQPFDAVGDGNIFTTSNGNWCASVTATNTLGATGFIQAYAKTPAGGLAIFNGEDNWFTDGPTNHGAQIFSLSLAEPAAPTSGLPCGVVASGITLSPSSATNNVGSSQTMTATVADSAGKPVSGVTVTFTVASGGPDAGKTGTGVTGSNGQATFTYSDTTAPGADNVTASFVDASTHTHTSNVATITWVSPTTATATSLSTSLSGGGVSGAQIIVLIDTAVTDTATLGGTNAATATGTV